MHLVVHTHSCNLDSEERKKETHTGKCIRTSSLQQPPVSMNGSQLPLWTLAQFFIQHREATLDDSREILLV